jgi:hypothetical protein
MFFLDSMEERRRAKTHNLKETLVNYRYNHVVLLSHYHCRYFNGTAEGRLRDYRFNISLRLPITFRSCLQKR